MSFTSYHNTHTHTHTHTQRVVAHGIPSLSHLLGGDLNVARHAVGTPRGLVDHEARVGEGVPHARGPPGEEETAHRGGLAHADRGYGWFDILHRVVDG